MKSHYFLILTIALLISSCSKDVPYRQANGSTWGTTYHITYRSDKDLSDSIVSVMRDIDMSLSPFVKESLISRVNRNERVKADSMLSEVIDLSRRVNALSGGMFDPTVAPLIDLWGFGPGKGIDNGPAAAQIDSALMSVGMPDCGIDSEGYVYKKADDTQFNFSAIAKGYGVDRIAEMLRHNGCRDYLVEVGGEMSLGGVAPSGSEWRIQVDAPVIDPEGTLTHSALQILKLSDVGIATSGNYRNRRNTSDGEVGHTISPVTGRPIPNTTLSATVIAPTSALADALATSVMAMADTSAIAMIESLPDVCAMLVKANDDGSYQLIYTTNFKKLVEK